MTTAQAWKTILGIGVAVRLVSNSCVQSAEWREFGPAPAITAPFTGRTSAVVVSPMDHGAIFAAAASGDVRRTENGGLSRTPLIDELSLMRMDGSSAH